MELILPGTLSIVCMAIIFISILISYYKKFMLTYTLIFSNFIIFILTFFYPRILFELGYRPIYLSLEYLPMNYTLITSMFLHGGFDHILGNMIIFLFMGFAFEQRIGWKKLLIIYILTGLCGAISHSLLNLGSNIILIGASGAIFGIMGAFAYSYPKDEVLMPIPLGFIMVFRRIKVIYAVLIFAALETIIVIWGSPDNTAHFAHLGGLVSGIIISALIVGDRGKKLPKPNSYVYYDKSEIPKNKKIDFTKIKKLATTPDLKEIYNRIENENVLQVRDVWLENFFDKATCPICGKKLKHFNGKVWCENNHYKIEY